MFVLNVGLYQPENLLLTSDGHIKLADFGSVKPTKDTPLTVLPNSTGIYLLLCTVRVSTFMYFTGT